MSSSMSSQASNVKKVGRFVVTSLEPVVKDQAKTLAETVVSSDSTATTSNKESNPTTSTTDSARVSTATKSTTRVGRFVVTELSSASEASSAPAEQATSSSSPGSLSGSETSSVASTTDAVDTSTAKTPPKPTPKPNNTDSHKNSHTKKTVRKGSNPHNKPLYTPSDQFPHLDTTQKITLVTNQNNLINSRLKEIRQLIETHLGVRARGNTGSVSANSISKKKAPKTHSEDSVAEFRDRFRVINRNRDHLVTELLHHCEELTRENASLRQQLQKLTANKLS